MDFLAQVNWEQAGVAAVAVIAALGGKEGIAYIVSKRRNGIGYVQKDFCILKHQELEKRQDERHAAMMTALDRVYDRIDQIAERRQK